MICGTGTNDTAHSVKLTREATEAGAHAVLVVTPYYNKPNRAGLKAHFQAVAAATDLPVVLYNIPSRCVINIDPELLGEIAAENENVVAVKQANNDDLGPIEGLDILAGNDEIFCRTLEIGGTGGILVASHLVGPEMRELVRGGKRRRPGPGARDRLPDPADLRGHDRDLEPDPGEGGARDARDRLRGECGCRMSKPMTSSALRSGGRSRRRPAGRRGLDGDSLVAAVRILPLGGLGEIGKNMTVVESEGRIVIVDTGLMFPTAEMLGIDLVLPDFSSLRERAGRHRGDRAHARP